MLISSSPYSLPGQTAFYQGKVRDVYTISDKYLVMVASDRISAFDVVLPKPIPYKGQVLNQIAAYFLQATSDIVPNWLISVPDPRVSVGLLCVPFKVEMVIRGYLSGHAWREYNSGKRNICGVPMPDNMRENDRFPQPIITPTTKASEGHDEDISKEHIIASGIVSKSNYEIMEQYTKLLFEKGTQMAAERGLILVDTKYEFGSYNGKIVLMDEIHTPDSSRYFYADGYSERQANGQMQKQLSKEFVREWLIRNNFMGKEGQVVPVMTDEIIEAISKRYIELFERITGREFLPSSNSSEEVYFNILKELEMLPQKKSIT